MILQILFAYFFTNIFGVLFDQMEKMDHPLGGKQYLNSTLGVLSMLLFRSIFFILKGIIFFTKKDLLNSALISLFVISIYLLFEYQIEDLGLKIKVLLLSTFCLWAVIYAYLAVSSKVLYEGKDILKLSRREVKIYFDEATPADRIILFITNILSSIFAPTTYILAIVTTLYVHFLGKLI